MLQTKFVSLEREYIREFKLAGSLVPCASSMGQAVVCQLQRKEKTQKLGGRGGIGICVREDFLEAVACSRVCGTQTGREGNIPGKGSCSLSQGAEEGICLAIRPASLDGMGGIWLYSWLGLGSRRLGG